MFNDEDYYNFGKGSDDSSFDDDSVPDPVNVEYEQFIDVTQLLDHVLSLHCKTREELVASVRVIQSLHEYDCVKAFNKETESSKAIKALWKRISALHRFDRDEIRARISRVRDIQSNSVFPELKAHLYQNGSRAILYRLDGQNFVKLSEDVSNVISVMIRQPDLLKEDFNEHRFQIIRVLADRITRVAAPKNWDSRSDEFKNSHLVFLQKFSSWFLLNGDRLDIREFKAETFKGMKESGVSMPCMADPKIFLEDVARDFAKDQYDAMALFVGEENIDIYPPTVYVDGGASLIATDDTLSPACLKWTPALYCTDVSDSGWAWRRIQRETAMEANLTVDLGNKDNREVQVDRAMLYKDELLKKAKELAKNKTKLRKSGVYAGGLADEYAEQFGVKNFISFYSRKMSTIEEITDNPYLIHFVVPSVAAQMAQRFKALIVEPVSHVVMLVPGTMFMHSKAVKTKTKIVNCVPYPLGTPYKGFQLAMSVIACQYHQSRLTDDDDITRTFIRDKVNGRFDKNAKPGYLLKRMFDGMNIDSARIHLLRLVDLYFHYDGKYSVSGGSSKAGKRAIQRSGRESKFGTDFQDAGYFTYDVDDDDQFGWLGDSTNFYDPDVFEGLSYLSRDDHPDDSLGVDSDASSKITRDPDPSVEGGGSSGDDMSVFET